MPGIRDWWNLNPPAPTPSARYGHAMAYDSARDKVLLFGGSPVNNETWEYDSASNTWVNRAPGSLPPARYWHDMVYDSARRKFILFGGHNGSTPLNDTWEYDPVANTWTNRAPASAPSARSRHGMVYDPLRGKVILFGGYTGADSNETWEYDPVANTWTNRTPASSPSGRREFDMVFDSSRAKVILFGGVSGSTILNETWEYDPVANAWTNRAPASAPSARYGPSMAFDSTRGKVVLFGGFSGSAHLNDTWEYDPAANTWTNRAPASAPSARFWSALVYNSSKGVAFLFGGATATGYVSDTWEVWLKLALLFAKTTGQPADDFNFGTVIANNVLGPTGVDLWNGTGTTVATVQVSIPDIPAGEVIELSKTADPFIPESPLVFSGTFSNDTKIGTLYVRIKPAITSSGDKQFTLSATSSPA